MTKKPTNISERVIALGAGGTGGHMFPAAALARELDARGFATLLVTDDRGKRFSDQFASSEIIEIDAGTPMRGGLRARVSAFMHIIKGVRFAYRLLRAKKVACVVGFGGYPSLPTALAARLAGIPYILHEQNAVFGRANRFLAGGARSIAISFADTSAIKTSQLDKVVLTGNPVRREIVGVGEKAYVAPKADGEISILAVGGSLGARIFADIIPAAMTFLDAEIKERLHVTQQCRPEDRARVAEAYVRAGIMAQTPDFIRDMAGALRSSHLVIARAGAGSVSEVGAARRPAIFVPLAIAANDHQTMNARALGDHGAAWVMSEAEFQPGPLAQLLTELVRDGERLKDAANLAVKKIPLGAAAALADLIEQAIHKTSASEETKKPIPVAKNGRGKAKRVAV